MLNEKKFHFKSILGDGLIGVAISIVFFIALNNYINLATFNQMLIGFFFFVLFGFLVGVFIPLSINIFHIIIKKKFKILDEYFLAVLFLTYIIGLVVFYIFSNIFLIFINIFFTYHIDNLIFISLGAGIISLLLHLFYIYYEQLDERIRLEKENKNIALIEERNRIARELHDSVSQNLFGISLHLNTLPAIIDKDRDRVFELTKTLQDMVQEVQTEMRLMIYELRPLDLKNKSFFEALEGMISLFKQRYKLDILYDFSGDENTINDTQQLALYRFLQEALNNIVKHAETKQVVISLTTDEEELKLLIKDNGKGFDIKSINQEGHFGIISMEERLEELGGSLKIESIINEGSKMIARIPR
ncbi:sensor histidine kinase [Natronospora cellulosivora (SeqCode)]